MAKKFLTITLIMGILITAPAFSIAADVDEFKAFYSEWLDNWNKLESDKIFDKVHEQVVMFGPGSPFAVEGKDVYKTVIESFFKNVEVLRAMPLKIDYRVLGDTAIVTGYWVLDVKLKDGPLTSSSERAMEVFVKEDGKWRYIASQEDRISLGD